MKLSLAISHTWPWSVCNVSGLKSARALLRFGDFFIRRPYKNAYTASGSLSGGCPAVALGKARMLPTCRGRDKSCIAQIRPITSQAVAEQYDKRQRTAWRVGGCVGQPRIGNAWLCITGWVCGKAGDRVWGTELGWEREGDGAGGGPKGRKSALAAAVAL
jgi:hypothetical protein